MTVQELAPDVGGVAEDDPWNPKNAVGVDAPVEEPEVVDEDEATYEEFVQDGAA